MLFPNKIWRIQVSDPQKRKESLSNMMRFLDKKNTEYVLVKQKMSAGMFFVIYRKIEIQDKDRYPTGESWDYVLQYERNITITYKGEIVKRQNSSKGKDV